MFGEPEGGVFNIVFWIGFFFVGAMFLSIVFQTKTWKYLEKRFHGITFPFVKRYDSLPYTLRNVVGFLSITLYCLGIIAIFIWLQS